MVTLVVVRNAEEDRMPGDSDRVPQEVAGKLAEHRARGPIEEHGVAWKPGRWERDDLAWLRDAVEQVTEATEERGNGWRTLRRRHVLAFAPPYGEVWAFFVAAMAWGYGDRAYGPARVARIFRFNGTDVVRGNLAALIDASRSGPERAWDALRTTHRTKWFGPAFATKVAYFAAFSDPDHHARAPRPLVADANTARALWHLCGLLGSSERRAGYLRYVELAHEWAAGHGWRADEVERALFEIGRLSPVRKAEG